MANVAQHVAAHNHAELEQRRQRRLLDVPQVLQRLALALDTVGQLLARLTLQVQLHELGLVDVVSKSVLSRLIKYSVGIMYCGQSSHSE